MTVSAIHAALRAATEVPHRTLEADADVEARLRDPARRVDVLIGLARFHDEAEMRVAVLGDDLAEARPAGRARALRDGLQRLGAPPQPAISPLAPTDASTALGWLYVAEGSALGGRVMRKAMVRDGIDLTGLEFLDISGEFTGPRWTACLTLIDRAVSDGSAAPDAVVQGALQAFAAARTALVAPTEASAAA